MQSNLELGIVFLEEATFTSLSIIPSTKALHKLCLRQRCQVINRVSIFWSG